MTTTKTTDKERALDTLRAACLLAAVKLAEKFGWLDADRRNNALVGGGSPDGRGNVYVFVNRKDVHP